MSKNQKGTKKFPKMKVILSVVLACLFGFAYFVLKLLLFDFIFFYVYLILMLFFLGVICRYLCSK